MYKIQNLTGKNLSISLERGAITIRPNGSFDLDTCCSRTWINSSREVTVLLRTNNLKLVLDSQALVPKIATKPVVKPVTVPEHAPGVIRVKPVNEFKEPFVVASVITPKATQSVLPPENVVVKEVFTPPTVLDELFMEPKLPEVKATPVDASELISYDPVEQHLKQRIEETTEDEEEDEENVQDAQVDEADEEDDEEDDEYL